MTPNTPKAGNGVTDEMVEAYLKAQREACEHADRSFCGALHTNVVKSACRAGLEAALAQSRHVAETLSDDEQHALWMEITGGDIDGWGSAREFARRIYARAAIQQAAEPDLTAAYLLGRAADVEKGAGVGAVPAGWRLVPVDPSTAQLDAAVAFALNVGIGGGYGWTEYMRDLYARFLAASPTPPVGQLVAGGGVPLSETQILDIAQDFVSQYTHGGTTFDEFDASGYARAIEAAHGINPVAGEGKV